MTPEPLTASAAAGSPDAPRFSVVVATYERKQYVAETIRSIREQTYPVHEIIIVVDGSSDGTAGMLRERFPDVTLFEQPNLGRSVARNTGVALATGDWICFLDDDDLWDRRKLETTACYLAAHPECEALTNPIWFFSDRQDGPAEGFGFRRDFVARDLDECHAASEALGFSGNDANYLHIQGNSFRLLLERCRGVMSASVVKRTTLIRAGCFCPMQDYADDWTMFVNVARLCEWHTLPQRLGFSRLHANQSPSDMNVLVTIVAQLNAWLCGRPLPGRIRGLAEALGELKKYGPLYRETVQHGFWSALGKGNFRTARLIAAAGKLLLPRLRDRFFIYLPPRLTWHWQYTVFKKHS